MPDLPTVALDVRLDQYFFRRGMRPPQVTNCTKPLEEAAELFAAYNGGGGRGRDWAESVMAEIADVVLSVAVVARHVGVTVEECIELKTEKDAGRG